ncbi:hypothetical protein Goshw_014742 [Gossypium schwendimanii]|uniref:Zinc knuckle CX2CX4HX4C domain-containing protein n=1 Tax=Gossypium schwendimanii TaxID=34291 RepID=A0A7J9L3D2_GOSSC|nr:hypothetical protein [Gossypium schwendimanii]
MKKSIACLSIDDKEEETIQLGVESSDREISYASSFVGMFLTSSAEGENPLAVQLNWVDFWMLIYDLPHGFMFEVVTKQLGCFIGVLLEYDASDIELRYKRIMGIRVRIDVRKPLKRKKKLAFSNGPPVYIRFEYEKLTLFCFLCGKLGHGESFARLKLFI